MNRQPNQKLPKKPAPQTDLVCGVDFGTTKICAVIGKKEGDEIKIVGIGKQPSSGIRKGVVVNIPSTVEALKKAIEVAELMAGGEISSAYCGIAGHHIKGVNSTGVVAIKNKEVSEQDVERAIDAAKAVPLQPDRQVIHVIPQDFTVNEQDGIKDPVGMAGVRLESKVHIVTGSTSSAQNLAKCVTQAGLQVADIVLEPLASADAVLTYDEKELGVAMVDIGGGTTDIAIYAHGSLVHTAVIAMGGNHVTNDIAVGLRTSIQDAERIKVMSGCAMSSLLDSEELIEVPSVGGKKSREISRSVLTKIIEPRIEEIYSLVGQEIANSGFKHLLSTGVVITGGGSLLEGMPELGEFILEVPVRRGIPQGVGGLIDVVSSPIYSTAVGLLRHGIQNKTGAGFKFRDENIYSKVMMQVKSWLGEVF